MKILNTIFTDAIFIQVFTIPACSQIKIFSPQYSVTVDINSAPSKIAVEEFNRDGFKDIGVTAESGLVILLNDGKGNFNQSGNSPLVAGSKPAHITLIDFNGDGHPDILATNFDWGTISVLLGNKNNGFDPYDMKSFRAGLTPVYSAAGDLNMDGITDAGCANYESNDITLLFNQGSQNITYSLRKIMHYCVSFR